MPAIKDLPIEHLRTAGNAIETVLDFSAYLPRVGRWLRLAGEFRDDIRRELGMPPLEPISFGPEAKQLDDLSDEELLKLGMAVYTLAASYGPLVEARHLTGLIGDLLGQIAFGQAARICAAEAQAS
jgi:hypothetical protein